ncbi:hypothetical protein HDU93_003417, partial [Gonapodya sp. JEL0774]
GSSLSPVVFNFFIDELIRLLLELDGTGLTVHGVRIVALFFADDGALVARSDEALARQLGVAEEWSRTAGMRFSPTKCELFAPPKHRRQARLALYDIDLETVDVFTYLGYPFTVRGIDWVTLCAKRCEKSISTARSLQARGMNVTGWAPAAAARIYKAFVRPVWEYGLDLKLPSRDLMAKYQKAQNVALRLICSAPPNTSIVALHRITGIPLVESRCREIDFLGTCRFHNSTHADVIGIRVYRNALNPNIPRKPLQWTGPPLPVSLPRFKVNRNPWTTANRASLMDHVTTPLTRVNPSVAPPPLPKAQRRRHHYDHLNRAVVEGAVEASIPLAPDLRPRAYLTSASPITRPQRVSLTRWQLGTTANHPHPCKVCGADLGRVHALECTGVNTELLPFIATIPPADRFGVTRLDVVINWITSRDILDLAAVDQVVEWIDRIETRCRRRTRTETGFWR